MSKRNQERRAFLMKRIAADFAELQQLDTIEASIIVETPVKRNQPTNLTSRAVRHPYNVYDAGKTLLNPTPVAQGMVFLTVVDTLIKNQTEKEAVALWQKKGLFRYGSTNKVLTERQYIQAKPGVQQYYTLVPTKTSDSKRLYAHNYWPKGGGNRPDYFGSLVDGLDALGFTVTSIL